MTTNPNSTVAAVFKEGFYLMLVSLFTATAALLFCIVAQYNEIYSVPRTIRERKGASLEEHRHEIREYQGGGWDCIMCWCEPCGSCRRSTTAVDVEDEHL
uniref:Uncharacterized protein n=1 Tax=Lotharella oceanica TaxID=641309 RepID=A0A7S2TRZ7_9EUKA